MPPWRSTGMRLASGSSSDLKTLLLRVEPQRHGITERLPVHHFAGYRLPCWPKRLRGENGPTCSAVRGGKGVSLQQAPRLDGAAGRLRDGVRRIDIAPACSVVIVLRN
jgi:hypothetical protein